MEVAILLPLVLGLLLLPLLAVLLTALCVRCRELSDSDDPATSDSGTLHRIVIKRPREYMEGPWPLGYGREFPGMRASLDKVRTRCLDSFLHLGPVSSAMIASWSPATSYPSVTSHPSLSQPDLLPMPRSPQPPGGSHQVSSSRQDSDGEPVCEDEDEDEDEEDYHNEGYLVVLPDTVPAACSAAKAAPVPSNPGLRDSAFSMESGEDYVNVPESEESADASLDGSREYVNVSQELQPTARTEPAILSSQEAEEEEEEGAPDYENLQELH
ncbi:linker for activation of T-cells family member 1 isoform X2 [Phyllostomus hastatus]|uniref:linker for activation of T-cells family member 1 isoform X2 n=1 Tax=Phyllostomus hastatus TaxID=9423 RepID=UPI001E6807C6|nr:linker for activation of T-cells family member 1 isoform X2 [Phyllostomus hastatus]